MEMVASGAILSRRRIGPCPPSPPLERWLAAVPPQPPRYGASGKTVHTGTSPVDRIGAAVRPCDECTRINSKIFAYDQTSHVM
jgi:hypothetical protein